MSALLAYDLTFATHNGPTAPPKSLQVHVVQPPLTPTTGLLHMAHGWGGNRFQYRTLQHDWAARYNLVCCATEFRQSGYDFDPQRGSGWEVPYDASFYQVLDCLNAMRTVLAVLPGLDRGRLYAFGGSQGGHLALLMAAWCPRTFALVGAASSVADIAPYAERWGGRHLSAAERAIRHAGEQLRTLSCPLALVHGLADADVPADETRVIEVAARATGQPVRSVYVPGAGHLMEPVTTRQAEWEKLADDWLRKARRDAPDDWARGTTITLSAADSTATLDWSRPPADPQLLRWGTEQSHRAPEAHPG